MIWELDSSLRAVQTSCFSRQYLVLISDYVNVYPGGHWSCIVHFITRQITLKPSLSPVPKSAQAQLCNTQTAWYRNTLVDKERIECILKCNHADVQLGFCLCRSLVYNILYLVGFSGVNSVYRTDKRLQVENTLLEQSFDWVALIRTHVLCWLDFSSS